MPISRVQWVTEIIALAAVSGLLVWVLPPDVNEAHYLAKAKHFWNRLWCPTDLFTNSHETHWLFYASFGWLTRLFSLEVSAWIGRMIAWFVVSWGLLQLIRCFDRRPWQSLLLAPMFILVNRYGHLAGEWFVGGIEAKAIAWGFVFAAIAEWLKRDRIRAGLYLSIAGGFHIVIGLWSLLLIVVASIAVRWSNGKEAGKHDPDAGPAICRSRFRCSVLIGLSLGFLITGLLPALQLNRGLSGEITRTASELQAFSRLAHHQDALHFAAQRWTAFLALLSIWFVLKWANGPDRRQVISKLNWLVLGAVALNIAGLVLSVAGHASSSVRPFVASTLALYWFRMADVLVPVVVVLHAFLWMNRIGGSSGIKSPQVAVIVIIGLAIFWNAWRHVVEPISGCAKQALAGSRSGEITRRDIEADRNWQRTCKWIRENTSFDSVFITPANQQTFKWYAGRSEVASWKDMPQNADGVLEWNERLASLYQVVPQNEYGLLGLYDHEIRVLADRYNAGYLIVETRFVDWRKSIGYVPAFEQVYPETSDDGKSTFTVFQLSGAIDN